MCVILRWQSLLQKNNRSLLQKSPIKETVFCTTDVLPCMNDSFIHDYMYERVIHHDYMYVKNANALQSNMCVTPHMSIRRHAL